MARCLCRSKKAGLSGLFCFLALILPAASVTAEPIMLEIVSAEAGVDQRTRGPIINLKLSEVSKRRLAEISQKHLGHAADFRIDGRIVMSPVFREPILGGSLQVSDKDLTIERARSLAAQISAAKGIEIEVPSD